MSKAMKMNRAAPTAGRGVNTQTLTATLILSVLADKFQQLTASGANRNVQLPKEGPSRGLWYVISNVGGSNNIVLKASNGTTTIVTLTPGTSCIVACNGTAWAGTTPVLGAPTTNASLLTTGMLADGLLSANVPLLNLSPIIFTGSVVAKQINAANAGGGGGILSVAGNTQGLTRIKMDDPAGDTVTLLNFLTQAGSRTYAVPDAGGDTFFEMGNAPFAIALASTDYHATASDRFIRRIDAGNVYLPPPVRGKKITVMCPGGEAAVVVHPNAAETITSIAGSTGSSLTIISNPLSCNLVSDGTNWFAY